MGATHTVGNSGQQGSGKTATYHHALTYLLQNTSTSHPKHLVKGIKDAESILSAFGHASASEMHIDASRFGRYVEVQFTPDGILGGWKILDFNLQKDIVHSNATSPDGQNFHIFYHLLAGASAEEKSEWCVDYT
jgi:chitin synthase